MRNFKLLFCVLIIVEFLHFTEGKRSFGLTSRRSKSKSPSVRRGQHGHDSDDHMPVPKPQAPDARKNIGMNSNQAHNTHNAPSAPPLGPANGVNYSPQGGLYSANHHNQPPPYGMHQQYGGSPPAYNQPKPIFGQNPAYGSPVMPMMGVMPMQSQNRGSSFGGGMMTNLFAGLAGYQLAKAFSGGNGYSHRERDVIIINNPPAQTVGSDGSIIQPSVPISNAYPHTPLNPPPITASSSYSSSDESTEIPQNSTQLMLKNNEYNYWGSPQYGIPLYGYYLPSQITKYYQIDTIKLNHDSQQQQEATS